MGMQSVEHGAEYPPIGPQQVIVIERDPGIGESLVWYFQEDLGVADTRTFSARGSNFLSSDMEQIMDAVSRSANNKSTVIIYGVGNKIPEHVHVDQQNLQAIQDILGERTFIPLATCDRDVNREFAVNAPQLEKPFDLSKLDERVMGGEVQMEPVPQPVSARRVIDIN